MTSQTSHSIQVCVHNPSIRTERKFSACDNYRGTSSLLVAGKILGKILLNPLNVYLNQAGHMTESLCGFRKDEETIDTIFTARQLQKKCQEQNVDLYTTFVDITETHSTQSVVMGFGI